MNTKTKCNHSKLWILVIFTLSVPLILQRCTSTQQLANNDTNHFRYEIEGEGIDVQGTYLIKVWSYSMDPNTAIEQAKKNAVHGVIFKGFIDNKLKSQGQHALAPLGTEENYKSFFNEFFKVGGQYLRFINSHNLNIGVGDMIKMGKEYKIGVVVSVNSASLRQYLENQNIIKALNSGF